jgi:hypothetical protein
MKQCVNLPYLRARYEVRGLGDHDDLERRFFFRKEKQCADRNHDKRTKGVIV